MSLRRFSLVVAAVVVASMAFPSVGAAQAGDPPPGCEREPDGTLFCPPGGIEPGQDDEASDEGPTEDEGGSEAGADDPPPGCEREPDGTLFCPPGGIEPDEDEDGGAAGETEADSDPAGGGDDAGGSAGVRSSSVGGGNAQVDISTADRVALARTGFDAWLLAILAGLSVAGGVGLLDLRRRGRRSH